VGAGTRERGRGKTGGDKQLREWGEEGGIGGRGEGTEESGRRMEAEILQGRPKALLATQNASQKSSEGHK